MAAARRAAGIVLRIVLAVGGGYGVTAGITALLPVLLVAAGLMVRSEAAILSSMVAFTVYLCVLLWAFAEPSLVRLAASLAATSLVSWGGAYGLHQLAGST